eukprot:UN07358
MSNIIYSNSTNTLNITFDICKIYMAKSDCFESINEATTSRMITLFQATACQRHHIGKGDDLFAMLISLRLLETLRIEIMICGFQFSK